MNNSIIKVTCPKCNTIFECIMPRKVKRTNRQNNYLHGVILPILSRHTGYTQAEMKDLIKSMFLKKTLSVQTKGGEKDVEIVLGSSEIKTDEFEVFTESVRRWAAEELGCNIPEPNEEL